jgi:hypothetical protein
VPPRACDDGAGPVPERRIDDLQPPRRRVVTQPHRELGGTTVDVVSSEGPREENMVEAAGLVGQVLYLSDSRGVGGRGRKDVEQHCCKVENLREELEMKVFPRVVFYPKIFPLNIPG